jgi:hypothetical protein
MHLTVDTLLLLVLVQKDIGKKFSLVGSMCVLLTR